MPTIYPNNHINPHNTQDSNIVLSLCTAERLMALESLLYALMDVVEDHLNIDPNDSYFARDYADQAREFAVYFSEGEREHILDLIRRAKEVAQHE